MRAQWLPVNNDQGINLGVNFVSLTSNGSFELTHALFCLNMSLGSISHSVKPLSNVCLYCFVKAIIMYTVHDAKQILFFWPDTFI